MTKSREEATPSSEPSSGSAAKFRLETVFDDPAAAARSFEEIGDFLELEPGAFETLLRELRETSDPDRALLGLRRCLASSDDPRSLLLSLVESPRNANNLLTLLAGSRYLTEILLRQPASLASIFEIHRRLRIRDHAEVSSEIAAELETSGFPYAHGQGEGERLDPSQVALTSDALRRVRQRELLRIGASDLLVLLDLVTVTEQLSTLADVMTEHSLRLANASLEAPANLGHFVVLALGKLGGRELNYSSDIDLVYLAEERPENYWPIGRRLRELMTRSSPQGFLYRVDLRLRPWGRDGELVHSLGSHRSYLERHASSAELQSMIKARPIAGNLELGRQYLAQVRSLVFCSNQSGRLRDEVRQLKERIERGLRHRGRDWGEVKSGVGSIRDIEFVTQYLQRLHIPHLQEIPEELASGNTLTALQALFEAGVLGADEHQVLMQGYVFLRTVEHYLQLASNRQVHSLPQELRQLTPLARRLGFEGGQAIERFLARYEEHRREVREVFGQHLEPAAPRSKEPSESELTEEEPAGVAMPTSYGQTFTKDEIARHRRLAAKLDGRRRVAVSFVPLEGDRLRIEIAGYDALGNLSLICGLLYAYGFNILDGHVFTSTSGSRRRTGPNRRRIIDAFTVLATPQEEKSLDETCERFSADLEVLMEKLEQGEPAAVQAELAKRIALGLPQVPSDERLYPIDVKVDNHRSAEHTVLEIEGQDTLGFLYELTNALTLCDVAIEHVEVRTSGQRVRDTLFVTDRRGEKIVEPRRLHQLRVAVALTKHFTHLLPGSPNPEQALLQFRQFLSDELNRENWEDEIATLDQPAVLSSLATLLGVSDFLWQDFLRMQHESLFPVLQDVDSLREPRSRQALEEELASLVEGCQPAEARLALNTFKDREMFRIDMRKILGHGHAFGQFSRELTELAEVVFEEAIEIALTDAETRFGQAFDEGALPVPFSLCALGKFGGRELGFASDLELMLLYDHPRPGGHRDGKSTLRSGEFYARAMECLLKLIERKKEGVFEVDLRLRPYGAGGPLAVSLQAFESYFAAEGDAWPYERQSLLKLRPVAGDPELGRRIAAIRDHLTYDSPDYDLAAHRALREKQIRHLVTPGTINAKYSRGCLVDVEYLVQLLQLRFGAQEARVRTTNTLAAIGALHEVSVLDARDYDVLVGAYRFLRLLIDALRMVRGHAKDLTVPAPESDEFRFLARRFGADPAVLQAELVRHTTRVPRLEARFV